MFAIQFTSRAYKLALSQRVTNFGALSLWIDNPDDLCATGKKIAQTAIYLLAGIVWRENLDCQIRRTGEKLLGHRLKAKALQSRFGNERDIGCSTVPVEHPMSRAGAAYHAQTVGSIKIKKGGKQPAANPFVLVIVFRAHDQFA